MFVISFLSIFILLLLFACNQEESNGKRLQSIIENYQDHEGYDETMRTLAM